MKSRKSIFAINGSASQNSSNEKLINNFCRLTNDVFDVTVFNDLKSLPHFDPELSVENTPIEILALRNKINSADGVLICTPEYVFSIPAGLKNAIEWCVSTTIFSGKPIGLITASASGQKGHEELQLIMKTVMAIFTDKTTLLIQGVKGKMNESGEITDNKTVEDFTNFVDQFKKQIEMASY
ncbi:NADPH-dependent FMN reductase [Flavihumibacter fluvii]|uniref:NADPH-dependent FMN reductase n=1 Tax=Flavihumibacter fluvii TaxID=2838157 RepID=UPI001BDE72C5|nr:NADPH-dependent FMN reductase [Flavihumibacter fluvii]ULQ51730.1 NAD(P)H-dependent oxidoreductase [Flavihumibacter fluvii]